MILSLDNFVDNDYIIEPQYVTADSFINYNTGINSFRLHDIEYIRGFPAYIKPISHGLDILQYLKPESLEKLRNGRTIFVMDMSMEGFDPCYLPIAKQLHESCLTHNIDPRKIYLLTGNHRESVTYEYYKHLFNFNRGINIVQTIIVSDMVISGNPAQADDIGYHIEKSQEKHNNQYFLHLSRRNRSHRTTANYLLSKSPCVKYALMSQDKLDENDVHSLLGYHNRSPHSTSLTLDEIKEWNNTLPITADSNEFHVNWASNRGDHLYHETLFSVVLETSADDRGGTAMFPSEKIFKPIVHRHPMIVFGHLGINTFLKELGFKTYEDWFNLEVFDFDTDPISRYKKILDQVNQLCANLEKMSKQERIEWRFKNQGVLNYNYDILVNQVRRKSEIFKLHKTINSYFSGHFFSHFVSETT